jgi:hypothetical protein
MTHDPDRPTPADILAVKTRLFNEGPTARTLICRARELMREAGFIPAPAESPLCLASPDLDACLTSHRRAA